MQEYVNEINYDELINNHLKGVIADALKIAEEQGLPGDNHFYITFKTNFPGVEIPLFLKDQYPESMTIVLQHQFAKLRVEEKQFSVELVFGGVPQILKIPYDAISYFADPYARFGLSFEVASLDENENGTDEDTDQTEHQPAEVISIDSFRKK